MKKLLFAVFSILFLAGCSADVDKIQQSLSNDEIQVLTLFSSKSEAKNKAWVGTFQLVFNDMKNNIIKNNIKFAGEKPTDDLIGLNKEEFNSSMLNESSYYTSYGLVKPSEKIKIQKAIEEKFSEKSDVLDLLDWTQSDRYYAYAMLKKKFEFYNKFDILDKSAFNNSKENYDFFGISENSNEALNRNVDVLFYNNENDYALELLTKTNDKVLLYRTDKNADLKTLYDEMNKKTDEYKGNRDFIKGDSLKVPNIKIDLLKKYPELCNKFIENTDIYFSEALETIQLELNNEGGVVKSEAIIMTKNSLIIPSEETKPRHFNFDKTFNLFLIDAGKENPYLALRIEDLKAFQK